MSFFVDKVGSKNNAAGAAGVGDGTETAGHFNIDDPAWNDKWGTEEYTLSIGKEDPEPKTCSQNCAEEHREREKKCQIVRDRVAYTLKKVGCPSTVKAIKKAKKRSCSSKTKSKKTSCGCKR